MSVVRLCAAWRPLGYFFSARTCTTRVIGVRQAARGLVDRPLTSTGHPCRTAIHHEDTTSITRDYGVSLAYTTPDKAGTAASTRPSASRRSPTRPSAALDRASGAANPNQSLASQSDAYYEIGAGPLGSWRKPYGRTGTR